jgi:NADH-quinone oxidoreductase subunit M
MILLALILVPLAGALACLAVNRVNRAASKWTALICMTLQILLAMRAGASCVHATIAAGQAAWAAELRFDWIAAMGISFHLAIDNMGFLFVILAAILGLVAVLASWKENYASSGPFYCVTLCTVAAITGVFLAADLFLFYIFWELMIIPLYFLIALWGGANRARAAMKFFLFTQAGAVLLLFSMLGLYFVNGAATGHYTFDYAALMHAPLAARASPWLMLGFFTAFAVKLGVVPFHGWVPEAYDQAPASAVILLSGVMAKTGAYGLIRFCIPLFTPAALSFSSIALVIGVVSVLYGAIMAFSQSDIKRTIAYGGISHMGFVVIGIFIWSSASLQGAMLQILSHGFAMGGIFLLIGLLQKRLHGTAFSSLGGLWADAPGLCSACMVFIFALMGIPGFGNFMGEFLILFDAFRVSPVIASLGALAAVFSALYGLKLVEGIVQGKKHSPLACADLGAREIAVAVAMALLLLALGLFPMSFFKVDKTASGSPAAGVAGQNASAAVFALFSKGDNP